MAWLTIDDLETYMGTTFTGQDAQGAEMMLELVTGELELHLKRGVEVLTKTDTKFLYAQGGLRTFVPLDRTPVATITSVVVDGTALTSDQWSIERSGVKLLTINFPQPITGDPPEVVIVYTGGLGEPALTELKFVVLSRSARLMNRREDDVFGARDASIEGYRILYQADEWTEREMKIADGWKRRMISRSPAAYGV